tara:strand:+ start:331 stop:1776 length:1446 start_codon:yes stop_codon:yes gene_type:complete
MRRFIKDLSGGLNTVNPPHLIQDNQLSVALDVVYRAGKWTKREGYAQLAATTETSDVIEVTDQIRFDGATRRLMATEARIYSWDGSSYTSLITESVARATSDKVYFAEINNSIYRVDGKNTPAVSTTGNFAAVSWDTGSSGRNLTLAKCVVAFNSRLLFFNVTDGTDGAVPFRVLWTDISDYDRISNLNYVDLDYSGAPIVAARRLGHNFIAIYKSDSIVTLQDQGSPLFFVPKARQQVGIIGPKALTDIPNGHVFVSNDGIYLFNGAAVEPIADRTVVNELFDNLNYTWKDNIYLWTDLKNREVIIHYPTGSSEIPDRALVWNYQMNNWSQWTLSAYSGFYRYRTVAIPEVYYGAASGRVHQRDTSGTDISAAIASTISTKAFHGMIGGQVLGATPENVTDYVQVNRIQTDATPASTTLSCGTADLGTDSPTYVNESITDVDGKAPKSDFNEFGRYTTVKAANFTSVSEFILDIETGGDS